MIQARINRWVGLAASILAVSALCSCAGGPDIYTPQQSSIQGLSVEQARNLVLKSAKTPVQFFECRGIAQGSLIAPSLVMVSLVIAQEASPDSACQGFSRQEISNVRIGTTSITVVGRNMRYNIPLRDLEPSLVSVDTDDGLVGEIFLSNRLGFYIPLVSDSQAAKQLTDALGVLKSAAPSADDEEALFQATARNYRAAATKPQLPEPARRFLVQAEGAYADKDYDAAADYYDQALGVAPWWPQAHFDRALVLSLVDDFPDAIAEMKRYLALVPNAQNARAAQDRIYDWERRATLAR